MSLALVAGVSGLVVQATAGTASAATGKFYVNNQTGNDGTNPCTVKKAPCKTISYALTKATGGGTIYITGGLPYNEQVTVTESNVTLKGLKGAAIDPQSGATITSASGGNDTPETFGGNSAGGTLFAPDNADTVDAIVAVNQASNVVITGLTIDGAGTEGADSCTDYVGINYSGASGTISKDTVEQVGGSSNTDGGPTGCIENAGINVSDSTIADSVPANVNMTAVKVNTYGKIGIQCDATTAANCNITKATVTGAGPTSDNAQNGIMYIGASSGTLTKSTSTGNSYTGESICFVADDCGSGIYDLSSGNPTITSNKVSGNDAGILLDGSYGNAATGTITKNTAENASSAGGAGIGIELTGDTAGINVANNKANDNPLAGIGLVDAGGSFGAGSPGFFLNGEGANGLSNESSDDGGTVQGNTADGNGEGGIFASFGSEGTNIVNNVADGNSEGGIVLDGAGAETVTGNTTDSNSDAGIIVSGDSGSKLTSNTSEKNLAGMYVGGPAHLNEFCGVDAELACWDSTTLTNNGDGDATFDPSRMVDDGIVSNETRIVHDGVTTGTSRTVTDGNLEASKTVSDNTVTDGLTTVTTTSSYAGVLAGEVVSGGGIPANDTVAKVNSTTEITLTTAATSGATAFETLTFSNDARTVSDGVVSPVTEGPYDNSILGSSSADFSATDVGSTVSGTDLSGTITKVVSPTEAIMSSGAYTGSGTIAESVTITGSNVLTSATANFTSTDVGASLSDTDGYITGDSILAVLSSTSVELGSGGNPVDPTGSAVGDSVTITGQNTLSSATANFTSADVHATVTGGDISGTITSVVSSTEVHLSAVSSCAVASCPDQTETIAESPVLTSASADFTAADNGATVSGNGIVGGSTITVLSATQALMDNNASSSQSADIVTITDSDVVESPSATFTASDISAPLAGSSGFEGDIESIDSTTEVTVFPLNVHALGTDIEVLVGDTIGGTLCGYFGCTAFGDSTGNTITSNIITGDSGVSVLADGPGSPEWTGPVNPNGDNGVVYTVASDNSFSGNSWNTAWDYSGPPATAGNTTTPANSIQNTWSGDTDCDPTTAAPQCS